MLRRTNGATSGKARRSRIRRAGFVVLLLVVALVASACNYAYGPFLQRLDQPVVLTGADLPDFVGANPARATLWRYDGGWKQIPVQVDQRHVVGFGSQPASNTTAGVNGTVYGNGAAGVTALQYSDPNTFVGADPNANFDANDELAFMGRDAGKRAPAGQPAPPGTTGAGREITLVDPDGGTPGYVYLWRGQAGADPSAGEDYVDYDFVLSSGNYKTTYKRADGPNPETSTVSTYAYDLGMIDRWKITDLIPVAGTGVDILDGFKAQFAFNTCGRSNHTFADAEGAFVANIDGPVRGIRSYVGANSGPLTQETLYFYADRIEQVTDLRVHAIPSILSFVDYSGAASGMEYGSSELGSATVPIDGNPDTVPSTVPAWEYVSGPQGVLTMVTELTTTATGLSSSLQWVDDTTPPNPECWGAGGYYGAAATTITGGIPNTDPRSVPFATFQGRKVIGVWPANLNAASWSPGWATESMQPLDASSAPY